MTATCVGCGRANRAGARFCTACGQALIQGCSACGAQVFDDERFCAQCGAPVGVEAALPAQPTSSEGERKQVTVLFADLVGSMELAERLDADEFSEVMQGLFEVCREAVEAFGGTVDKFTGDGVMALFGAPMAQEDHAGRACHAALRLVRGAGEYALTLRQRGLELAVRVGLNSGEVVAGAVGEAFTAVGHTVGLAQRMESIAAPGEIRLSEHAAALVGAEFRVRDLGPARVKGSSLLLRVFALDGAAGGSAAAGRRRGGSARLVGRDTELALLRTALTEAQAGRAQVVGIVADAGTGKSRLCEELARYAAELGVTVRRTAGVLHARDVPLLPILGLLRDLFTVTDEASAAQVRDMVARRLLGLDITSDADLGLLFDFMEVPDPTRPVPQLGAEARRRRVLEVLRRVTTRRSEQQTLLLILEDLHWFDPHSAAFLEAWLPSFPGTRTLVVTNFRPEFHAMWMGRSYYRQLPLAPLDRSAGDALLAELLGTDSELTELSATVLERAGGNPFFIEEIVRGLAADGTLEGRPGAYRPTRSTGTIRIPASVQAVLATRIDRLGGRDRTVLQAASVIGRTFSEAVLRIVVGSAGEDVSAALHELCAVELVQETGAADEFRFWHPLTQEVAYGSLLGAGRRRLHRAVVAALVGSAPERHDELAALIATHADAAGDDLGAARWQLRAGTRAIRSDVAEAQRRWRLAVDHLALVPECGETFDLGVRIRILLLRLGARTGMDPSERTRLFAEARRAAEQLGDPVLFAGLSMAAGVARLWGGDAAGALASWQEARRFADDAGDPELRAWVRAALCAAYAYTGPLADGFASFQEALVLCGDDPATGTAVAGYSAHDLAHTLDLLLLIPAGRLDDARRLAVATLAYFDRRPVAEWRSWTLSMLAHIADWIGESAAGEAAQAAAEEALHLAQDSGNVAAGVRARHAAGTAAMISGDHDRAIAEFDEALRQAREHNAGLESEAALLVSSARAQLARASTETARTLANEAIRMARAQGTKIVECQAQFVRARVFRETAAGDADLVEARASLVAGEALAVETGAATYAAFLAEERAHLDGDAAALKSVADGYEAIGATGHARRVRDELGSAEYE